MSLLSALSSAQKTVVGCGQRQQVPHTVHEEALLGEDDREDPVPDPSEAWTKTAEGEYRFGFSMRRGAAMVGRPPLSRQHRAARIQMVVFVKTSC